MEATTRSFVRGLTNIGEQLVHLMGRSCLKKLTTWIDLNRRKALTSQENEEMPTKAVVKAVLVWRPWWRKRRCSWTTSVLSLCRERTPCEAVPGESSGQSRTLLLLWQAGTYGGGMPTESPRSTCHKGQGQRKELGEGTSRRTHWRRTSDASSRP